MSTAVFLCAWAFRSAAFILAGALLLRVVRVKDPCQNSSRAWKATMRGELSPPSPTPSSPVGGEVVYVSAPKPVCVDGLPGTPA